MRPKLVKHWRQTANQGHVHMAPLTTRLATPGTGVADVVVKTFDYTVVECSRCAANTIYGQRWQTMSGWAMDIETRRWMCPDCARVRDGKMPKRGKRTTRARRTA